MYVLKNFIDNVNITLPVNFSCFNHKSIIKFSRCSPSAWELWYLIWSHFRYFLPFSGKCDLGFGTSCCRVKRGLILIGFKSLIVQQANNCMTFPIFCFLSLWPSQARLCFQPRLRLIQQLLRGKCKRLVLNMLVLFLPFYTPTKILLCRMPKK